MDAQDTLTYYHREQKFHTSAPNYEWNLERTSDSSQSTHPVGQVLWEELLVLSSFTLKSEGETSIFFLSVHGMQLWISFLQWYKELYKSYYSHMFFIVFTFKAKVHVFVGRVKIVSHWSCRTSAILKYFCPLYHNALTINALVQLMQPLV